MKREEAKRLVDVARMQATTHTAAGPGHPLSGCHPLSGHSLAVAAVDEGEAFLNQLEALGLIKFDEPTKAEGDNPRRVIELLARQMCLIDGRDPELHVTRDVLARGPFNTVVVPTGPSVFYAWQVYLGVAETAFEFFRQRGLVP